jgi:hypothetical protein
MKQCPNCGLSNPDDAVSCECMYDFAQGTAAGQPLVRRSEVDASTGYTPTYNTARGIAQLVSAIGWFAVGIGGLVLLAGMSQGRGGALMSIVPALGAMLGGFLLVSTGQLTRAAVDTADHTGAILAVLKTTSTPR